MSRFIIRMESVIPRALKITLLTAITFLLTPSLSYGDSVCADPYNAENVRYHMQEWATSGTKAIFVGEALEVTRVTVSETSVHAGGHSTYYYDIFIFKFAVDLVFKGDLHPITYVINYDEYFAYGNETKLALDGGWNALVFATHSFHHRDGNRAEGAGLYTNECRPTTILPPDYEIIPWRDELGDGYEPNWWATSHKPQALTRWEVERKLKSESKRLGPEFDPDWKAYVNKPEPEPEKIEIKPVELTQTEIKAEPTKDRLENESEPSDDTPWWVHVGYGLGAGVLLGIVVGMALHQRLRRIRLRRGVK